MSQQNRTHVNWKSGVWLNQPLSAQEDGHTLKVAPEKGKDFWRKTLYGFEFENAPALLKDWDNSTGVEVSFQLDSFTQLYDQAGLLLYHGPGQWKDAVIIRARTEHHGWRTIRVARFPYPTGNQAGPYTCSPTREGFEATFTRWDITAPDQDLHIDPPVE